MMENDAPQKDLSADILFEPLRIGSMELSNRIVMAQTTRGFRL